jgi:hypothetical protein
VILGRGGRGVVGWSCEDADVEIVCQRGLGRNFVPVAYFEVVATAKSQAEVVRTRPRRKF